jgi:predicted DNA-binding transcriptional regulator AlpA
VVLPRADRSVIILDPLLVGLHRRQLTLQPEHVVADAISALRRREDRHRIVLDGFDPASQLSRHDWRSDRPSLARPRLAAGVVRCGEVGCLCRLLTVRCPESDRFLKIKEVIAITGKSRSSLYKVISVGEFSAQVKIGPRSSVWLKAKSTSGEIRVLRRVTATSTHHEFSTFVQNGSRLTWHRWCDLR